MSRSVPRPAHGLTQRLNVGAPCQAGVMLLSDVATASAEVGAVSARSAKIARIAALLGTAADDPATVAIVVHWLSRELPQRQIGVG